jgi:hypothetical protein
MNQIIIRCAFTACALFTSIQSFAWRSLRPFQETDKSTAQTVFEGEPTGYALNKDNGSARISYKVVRTLHGEHRSSWDVGIRSSTNWRIPASLADLKRCFGTRTEVGVVLSGAKHDQVAAVQGVCDPPYLISLTGKGTNCIP